MRPHPRWRTLFERLARLFRRAVPPAPPRVAPPGARRGAGVPREGFDGLVGAAAPSASAGDGPGDASLLGDFTDQEEVQRFAGLPPIGAEALEGVDWDELARELTGPR